jgi:hypothetical protein
MENTIAPAGRTKRMLSWMLRNVPPLTICGAAGLAIYLTAIPTLEAFGVPFYGALAVTYLLCCFAGIVIAEVHIRLERIMVARARR